MICYTTSVEGVTPAMLQGFFVGWLNPLTPEQHLHILQHSAHVVLARDEATDAIVGFINAISDGIFSAYIPLLEVLPDYQKRGIGQELVQRMLKELEPYYMIDLTCDPELQPFYKRFGMFPSTGMMFRNHKRSIEIF